jgi:hypothetical protein
MEEFYGSIIDCFTFDCPRNIYVNSLMELILFHENDPEKVAFMKAKNLFIDQIMNTDLFISTINSGVDLDFNILIDLYFRIEQLTTTEEIELLNEEWINEMDLLMNSSHFKPYPLDQCIAELVRLLNWELASFEELAPEDLEEMNAIKAELQSANTYKEVYLTWLNGTKIVTLLYKENNLSKLLHEYENYKIMVIEGQLDELTSTYQLFVNYMELFNWHWDLQHAIDTFCYIVDSRLLS